jgi:hypothetical protein
MYRVQKFAASKNSVRWAREHPEELMRRSTPRAYWFQTGWAFSDQLGRHDAFALLELTPS